MKVAIITLAVVTCALGRPDLKVDDSHHQKKQQDIWEVVKYINNPIYHEEHAKIASTYSLEENAHHYKNDALEHFIHHQHHNNYLKKGEIFSVFDEEHVGQAKALFKLFYHSDSYQTFHYTALWARHHLNQGLFLYTYYVAILHRPDTQGLVLPPIHEMYPHYFFNSEVLQKAYQLKMAHKEGQEHHHEGPLVHMESHGDKQEYTIHSEYSGHYMNLGSEQSLSYYLEDVGLNSFYFYFNLHHPYWMDHEDIHPAHKNRGEIFYFLHKQLLARYRLERLSHGVGDVESFSWNEPFVTGYYPSLVYPNGLAFPERPHFANLKDLVLHYAKRQCDKYHYGLEYVQIYEQRIREAIDSGIVIDHEGNKHHLYSKEGMDILGDIIEGNEDSPNVRYYGSYINVARHLLGYSKPPLDQHKLAPSALEHYSTSLRDPGFYHLYKKVLHLFDQYKKNLPPYHSSHLRHQGLEVAHVEVDPLVTFYDHHHSDITNGLYVTPEEYENDSFRVKVHQYRLNHKNFNYKIHVKSQESMKAVVKVFIGPKHDHHGRPLNLCDVHGSVFQIDHFVHDLKAGENVILRNSADYRCFAKDRTSYYEAYRRIMQGQELSGSEYHHHHTGFPLRFKLPRGSEEGTSFQIYVIVYPYSGQEIHQEYENVEEHGHQISQSLMMDHHPLGYPFDRPCVYDHIYHVPNAYVKHVKIYHQVMKNAHQDIWRQHGEHHIEDDVEHNYHDEEHQGVHQGHQEIYDKHFNYGIGKDYISSERSMYMKHQEPFWNKYDDEYKQKSNQWGNSPYTWPYSYGMYHKSGQSYGPSHNMKWYDNSYGQDEDSQETGHWSANQGSKHYYDDQVNSNSLWGHKNAYDVHHGMNYQSYDDVEHHHWPVHHRFNEED